MKDHTCHVPGSTRSRRTPLPGSATTARRFHAIPKNPYKTRTKPDHFRICEFFNCSPTTTYNFNALKCTDFLGRGSSPLPRGEGPGEGQTGSALFFTSPRRPISLTASLSASPRLCVSSPWQRPYNHCTSPDRFRKRPEISGIPIFHLLACNALSSVPHFLVSLEVPSVKTR